MKEGSLVECTNDTWGFTPQEVEAGMKGPVKGPIYTVRDIVLGTNTNAVGVRLEEIRNPKFPYSDGPAEPSFDIRHFRELQPPMDMTEICELFQNEPQTV